MAIYQELEAERKTLYENYKNDRKKGSFGIAGIIVSSLVIYLGTSYSFIAVIGLLGLLASIIVISVFATKASKHKSKFDRIVKESFVDKILNEHFEISKFHENSYISIDKINSVGLVKRPDKYRGEDLIIGKYKDVDFQVSDIVLTERQVVSTGKNTYVQYIDYFKGRWYVYKFPKNFNQTLKIVEATMGVETRGLTKYETEMIDFNKKFKIYSSDHHFFLYIMNPYLIERLLMLENAHRGSIHYCFRNDELHIGINDNSDSLQVSFNKEINENSLKRFIEDIVLIKTIVDELRLYDIKFRE